MKKNSPCHPNTDEMRSRGSAAALLLYASADGATALPAEYFYAVRVYVTVACPLRAAVLSDRLLASAQLYPEDSIR